MLCGYMYMYNVHTHVFWIVYICNVYTCVYSGTSLIRTPLGQKKVSISVRCPDFSVVMNSGRVFGTAKCVLFIDIKVSSFQGVLIRVVLLYMITSIHFVSASFLLYVSYFGAMASPGPGLSGNQTGGCDGSQTSGLKDMDGNKATHPPESVGHHRIVLNGTMYIDTCVCKVCVCTHVCGF